MPKGFYTINDFSGGINDAFEARDINENEFSEADNVILDKRKSVQSLGGDVNHTDVSGATSGGIAPGYGAFVFESDHENVLALSNTFATNKLAFSTAGDNDTITLDAGDSFHTKGYVVGDILNITGCTDETGNNVEGVKINAISADGTVMTLEETAVFTNDANEAGTVTIQRIGNTLDTGENWLCIADAKTGTIDLYNLREDTINVSQIDLTSGGSIHSYGFGAGNFDIIRSSTGDTITDDANDVMITQNFRKGDIIAISGAANVSNNINAGRIKSISTSQDVITLDQGNLLTTQADDANDITITKLLTAVYYFAEESLRVADASFGPTLKPYWYGHIERTHFEDATNILGRRFNGWYSKGSSLTAPTELTTHASNYPSAGTGFILKFTDGNQGTGAWENIAYSFGLSFIYDGNQESLIYESGTTHTPANNDCSLTIELRALAPFEPRISGARIYIKANDDDSWTLFTDISMQKGARMSLGNTYTVWANNSTSNTQVKITGLESTHPNLETYEILNGFGNDEQKIDISGNGEGYKAAIVANRRCFVANVKTQNEEGVVTQMRDRIMYTPVGKFDTFPRSYFIDVVKGDSEEYISLQEYSDRLLAFKTKKLFIINIAQSNPAGWFLEDIKDFSGCEQLNATCKTEFGIAWVNQYGVYLYNGQSTINLMLNKISESTWASFFTRNSSIGYNPKKYYLVILKDSFASDGDVYIYDFRTQSWTRGSAAVGSNYNRTNMLPDWNGNLTTVFTNAQSGALVYNLGGSWQDENTNWEADADNYQVKEWSDSPRDIGENSYKLVTKDIDFGVPGIIKKFHSIIITYKSDNNQTNPVSFATDNDSTFTSLTGNFVGATGFQKIRLKPSTAVKCQSIRFKITNSGNTGTTQGIQINDISVEYRPLYKRVS